MASKKGCHQLCDIAVPYLDDIIFTIAGKDFSVAASLIFKFAHFQICTLPYSPIFET